MGRGTRPGLACKCIAAAIGLIAAVPFPAVAGRPPELAFVKECFDLSECGVGPNGIYSMQRDGDRVRRLTSGRGDRTPAWSRDGTKLAFARCEGSDCDIWIKAEGTERQVMETVGSSDLEPSWSPDGASLAFTRCPYGEGLDTDGCEIWTRSLATGAERQLTDNGTKDDGAAWAPNGRWIAFERDLAAAARARYQVFLIGPDGSSERQLTYRKEGGSDPDWAPRSRRIVFRGSVNRLFVKNITSGRRRALPRNAALDESSNPSFSPTGKRVAWQFYGGDDGGIAVTNLETRRIRYIYSDYWHEGKTPDWRPSG